ncbi:FliM/FliN family flagellar motor C-terminal domain-containing protein [Pseudoxanthomonas sp. PXM02]|uniref:FliM/FliN family flagellar motor switch protein n=1 Tax=Pseudoxanthomonas sp. PXM02 TaxID=2769294 RepID=UPI00178587C4|nr:FliM/FliN family flagellar motor C-terminal domain-containing protein [Pseudoxanthomonas sp. PXM02]MBD9477413.1 FliM/FliN family flagellar motor switch protein [Pseudoxanthomonas sp. PXM02]
MNAEVVGSGKDVSLVGHVNVSLVAQIGHAELTVEELFALKKGDAVRLEEGSDAIVTLLLNGRAVALGELVCVDDRLGVRITELA